MKPIKKATSVQEDIQTNNFIVKVIEDKKRIVDTLKNGGKLSSIPGIKIVAPI